MKQILISKILYHKFKVEQLSFKIVNNRTYKLNNLIINNMLKIKELVINNISYNNNLTALLKINSLIFINIICN